MSRFGKRKYVAAIYDEPTQERLREFCLRYGFDITHDYNGEEIPPEQFVFHTTIFFTTSQHKMSNAVLPFRTPVIPIGFELLGKEHDVPVFRVESENIRNLRNSFADVYGMQDEWPDFKPHLSLSYKYTGDGNFRILPDFPLMTDRIVIKDQNEDNA